MTSTAVAGWARCVPEVSGGALASVGGRKERKKRAEAIYQLQNGVDDGGGVDGGGDDGDGDGV